MINYFLHQSLNISVDDIGQRLPSKSHQLRVKHNGQQEVENNHRTHRPNSDELRDPPVLLQCKSHGNHDSSHTSAEHEAPLELSQHPADSNKETNVFTLLGSGTPFERPAEEVREEGLRNVQGDAAKKYGEERDPLHICPEPTENILFLDAVAEDSEGDVSEDTEDNYDGEVYCGLLGRCEMKDGRILTAEGVDVVMI